ncbi:hypothetical protein BGW39_008848 [Mortierella sp. 14UC]|nr:hypothetical protein BGW39_008848 [Mortierella sp. 14UC]
MTAYATQHGVDTTTAALTVGVMSGSSAVGRILMGFLSDRIGCINALCLSTFLAALSILTIWIAAKTIAVMFVFSVAFGFCIGAYMSLAMSVVGVICGVDRLAAVAGVLFAGMAIGDIIGAPIAGTFLDTIGYKEDYTALILWTGVVMMVGCLIQFGVRFLSDRRIFVVV